MGTQTHTSDPDFRYKCKPVEYSNTILGNNNKQLLEVPNATEESPHGMHGAKGPSSVTRGDPTRAFRFAMDTEKRITG